MSHSLYWIARKAEDVPEIDDWLSEAERNVLAGFRFPKRRNEWRLGRWTAKQAVCACPMQDTADLTTLEIRAAADGAPEVFRDGAPAGVSISISHSNGRGFCVVGSREISVGCDVELIQSREVRFFQDYFAPEEIALLQNPPAERSLVAYLIWCTKESALKVLREGLRLDTRRVIVNPDFKRPDGLWNTWTGRCVDSRREFQGWWRSQDGFVYAITADQPAFSPIRLSMD